MSSRAIKKSILSLSLAAFAGAMVVTGPVGCANPPKKADIPANANMTDEANRLSEDISQGFQNHYDVLAQKDFDGAQDKLAQAKKEITDGKKAETIADSLGQARAYFERARQTADSLHERTAGILEARTMALKAGAHDSARAHSELKLQDDNFRSQLNNIEKGKTTPEQWAALQRGYLNVELHAIEDGKLGQLKAKLDDAVKNGARKNCPNAFAQAERDFRTAQNMIASSRHNEEAYKDSVEKANQSAQLMVEILAATKRRGGVINEDAARTIVLQSRKLNSMGARLNETSEKAQQLSSENKEANEQLQDTAAVVKLNKALESARNEFSSSEAEVYRQGDKLLIRLKGVNFPSGRADLPAQSLSLLSKVKSITEELNPEMVVVQGHTDSTGKKQTNKILSQERAETVANYLAENGVEKDKINAIGFGYEKPLASNKSKEGRAENRRVDIIITPGPTTVGNTQQKSQ